LFAALEGPKTMFSEVILQFGTAILGGVILNLMPCVLPVLTMKVFHVLEQAHAEVRIVRLQGVMYTLGILFSFAVFAGLVIAIRASGDLVGWGMQFQNPRFVGALVLLMLVLGLNGLGFFELRVGMSTSSDDKGYWGSFINGVVASVMATPCSAPFLGAAAAYALGRDTEAWVTFVIFLGIGLGLALPFLVISFVPAARALMPKPGMWMNHFRKFMGFSLLGAAVWLYGVLAAQVTHESSSSFLFLMLALAIGIWVVETFAGLQHGQGRRLVIRGAVLAALVGAGTGFVSLERAAKVKQTSPSVNDPVIVGGHINWAPFDPLRVALENRRGRPVFMDYTADWCLNCKSNEKLIIETQKVRDSLKKYDIFPMVADWTNENEVITQWLEKLGRTGIPTYAVYFPDGSFDLLPEVITQEMLLGVLNKAAEKFPKGQYRPLAEACLGSVAADATVAPKLADH